MTNSKSFQIFDRFQRMGEHLRIVASIYRELQAMREAGVCDSGLDSLDPDTHTYFEEQARNFFQLANLYFDESSTDRRVRRRILEEESLSILESANYVFKADSVREVADFFNMASTFILRTNIDKSKSERENLDLAQIRVSGQYYVWINSSLTCHGIRSIMDCVENGLTMRQTLKFRSDFDGERDEIVS